MANQVVKVRRETVAACMTCPLCNKLLRDATTISECLHTFCRKCIYEKISDDEIESCPVCNIDLGGTPLEKLRPDHNLQDLRAKIFPFKRRKVKAPEAVTSVTLPARRKKRSISSLVISTPRVSAQAGVTGRRTKGRKDPSFRVRSSSADRTIKKEEDSGEDRPQSGGSSPETLNKFTQNKRQTTSSAEHKRSTFNKEVEDGAEPWEAKLDLWKPLNFLVEVANRTKSLKTSHGSYTKSQPRDAHENEGETSKTKTKEHKSKFKTEDEKINNSGPTTSDAATPKRLRRTRRKRSATFTDSSVSMQAALDSSSAKRERRNGPVWFSLVASDDQEGEAPLPQIQANYLRIKDGNIPVSFIQKYLMRKLDLKSETEIEIRCMGQPVVPTLRLHNLVDQWLQTAAKHQRVSPSIGSSAKDFVMVLAYVRKVPDPK